MAPVEGRIGVLEDDLQRAHVVARRAARASAASARPSSVDVRPSSARRGRAACGRASSCRCPTRPRGRASRPARSPPRRPTSACTSCPCCLNDLAEVVEPQQRRRRAGRSPAAPCRRPSHAAASAHARGSGSGCMCPPPSSWSGGSSVRQTVLGERAASGEDAARQILAEHSAGSRGSCRAGRGPCARRRAGCSAAGRPCTGGAGRGARARSLPPRRGGRHRGRRRDRTSSR